MFRCTVATCGVLSCGLETRSKPVYCPAARPAVFTLTFAAVKGGPALVPVRGEACSHAPPARVSASMDQLNDPVPALTTASGCVEDKACPSIAVKRNPFRE